MKNGPAVQHVPPGHSDAAASTPAVYEAREARAASHPSETGARSRSYH